MAANQPVAGRFEGIGGGEGASNKSAATMIFPETKAGQEGEHVGWPDLATKKKQMQHGGTTKHLTHPHRLAGRTRPRPPRGRWSPG